MAYIVRVIKGRYTYLYEGTSRRVPGKKHPVSDRIYIGRVDNETNRFIPKSYTVSERLDVDAWEFRIRRLPRIPRCYLPLSQYPTDRGDPLRWYLAMTSSGIAESPPLSAIDHGVIPRCVRSASSPVVTSRHLSKVVSILWSIPEPLAANNIRLRTDILLGATSTCVSSSSPASDPSMYGWP